MTLLVCDDNVKLLANRMPHRILVYGNRESKALRYVINYSLFIVLSRDKNVVHACIACVVIHSCSMRHSLRS